MKILTVRGKNLASLEEEFILDFTSEPLKSAGIFAITGATGSGKSTILDALCLALFDNTPRMNQAGEQNVFIPDTGESVIRQRDCRSVLRRGAGEGYAEVDFVSLGGEKFRSTWSVKRARGRADGVLQNTEIKLRHLSSGREVQGRKSELLTSIAKLTGLRFEQFTRAVLLAQGDFASFLKAKQSEKAELLEKLTGTDVYSKISTAIYEKTKNADQEYRAVKEKIRDIELLSDEQMEARFAEKERNTAAVAVLKAEINEITAKIKWIDEDETLRKNTVQAETHLEDVRHGIAEAKPRYDNVALIEKVQEIRDSFNEWQNAGKRSANNRADLQQKQAEFAENAEALEKAGNAHAALEREQNELKLRMEAIRPEAMKARALDVQIKGAETNAKDADREYRSVLLSKEQIETRIRDITKDIALTQVDIDRLASWFQAHDNRKEIVAQADRIITLLDDAQSAKEQNNRHRKLWKENAQILETETVRLATLKEEAARLNLLLPAEIAVLRAKLKDGVPCPVCGSVHHPLQSATGEQSLQEAELNRAKDAVARETEQYAGRIETRKVEITRLAALTETYAQQFAGAMEKVGVCLKLWNSWEEDFKQGVLTGKLKEMVRQWTENAEKLAQTEGKHKDLQASNRNEQNNLIEIQKYFAERERKKTETAAVLADLQKERAKLLGGKSVDDLAREYAGKEKEIAERWKTSAERKNALAAKQEMLTGVITQMNSEIDRLEMQCAALKQHIDAWLVAKRENITWEQLPGLMSKDRQWLHAENQFLNGLKEQETSAVATLEERKRRFAAHRNAEIKPKDGEETKEALQAGSENANARIEQYTKRIVEIEASFVQHNKEKERLQTLEKTLVEKETLSENWKRLNELFGSAGGSKFKEIAQTYTLDVLLTYANKHLNELTKRYELQRIPDTLALQVIDLDMLGEIRTVHSLSGGEAFLVSLALALGLSSLSSNQLKIETLFIDEGFGSLDADTLRAAMDVMEQLQMQGRKIGVISHVAEMTERIAVRVAVVKTANGKSRVKVLSHKP
ncbi:MAG: AAA family ATPase [Bacteroidales bacterium]|jgi:exonuclease SbcC|nr:AAA family ATPase [Bacteroidales bacterium]